MRHTGKNTVPSTSTHDQPHNSNPPTHTLDVSAGVSSTINGTPFAHATVHPLGTHHPPPLWEPVSGDSCKGTGGRGYAVRFATPVTTGSWNRRSPNVGK